MKELEKILEKEMIRIMKIKNLLIDTGLINQEYFELNARLSGVEFALYNLRKLK